MRIEQFYNNIAVAVGPAFLGPLSSTGAHYLTGFLQGTTGNYTGANAGFNLITWLDRLQNISTSYDLPKREMVQLGQQAAFSREIVDPSSNKASFNYFLTNGVNEQRLGLPTNGIAPLLSGILSSNSASFNLFTFIAQEGVDANGDISTIGTWTEAIGDCYISNIGFKAAVGGVGEGSIALEGSNTVYYSGISGFIPSVDPVAGVINQTWVFNLPVPATGQDTISNQPTVLKYGDITLNLGALTGIPGALWNNDAYGNTAAHLQSFDISIPLNLEAINELGNKVPYSRRPRPPLNAKIKVDAIVSDMATGNLLTYLSQCSNLEFPMTINMYACSGTTRANVLNISLAGVSLDSQDFSVAVGNKKVVSATFTCPIGSASDSVHQIYLSGSHILQNYGPFYY